MKRIDYNGPEPPEHIQEQLITSGGLTPTGLPKYRLVHAPDRLSPSGGAWVDWDEELSLSERKQGVARPTRTVNEVRMTPRYPEQTPGNWILEKWSAPQDYGTPEAWYLPRVTGGTMEFIAEELKYIACLGEYPYEGDYEHIGYCIPADALTVPVIETAVGRFERGLEELPATDRGRMLRVMYNAKLATERKHAADRQHTLDLLDETDFAFGGAQWSGGYGAKRSHAMNHYAKLAGVTSHVR